MLRLRTGPSQFSPAIVGRLVGWTVLFRRSHVLLGVGTWVNVRYLYCCPGGRTVEFLSLPSPLKQSKLPTTLSGRTSRDLTLYGTCEPMPRGTLRPLYTS